MKCVAVALLACSGFLSLAGCSVGTTGSGSTTAAPNLSGNWQLGSVNTTPNSSSNLLLLGALASSGSNVTGTFRFSNLAPGNGCGALNQVVTVSGSVSTADSLVQTLNLTSAPFSGSTLTAQFTIPAVLPGGGSLGTLAGTIQVTGSTCAFPSSQAVAIEFPAVTGTFTGSVAPSTSVPGNVTTGGNVTLTATQSATPNPDGQFAVTGSLAFVSGTCTMSQNVSGTASGGGLTLTSPVVVGSPNLLSMLAINTPLTIVAAAGQLQIASLSFYPAPCQASLATVGSYTGILTRQ